MRELIRDNESIVAVTVMRNGSEAGNIPSELEDGNMISRLCQAVGFGACEQTCQLRMDDNRDILCAENNILRTIKEFGTTPDRFLIVSATEDNVRFGDDIDDAKVSDEGYGILPASNAFFFRPGIDEGPSGEKLDAIAMRMADCGSRNYRFRDRFGNLVLGQEHDSRTNMHGPSVYKHELESGEKVSWTEHVLEEAIKHYGADPAHIQIFLSAAVEGKDFIHNYDSIEKMEAHYPGWDELGFMKRDEMTGDTLINYRGMISYQTEQAKRRSGLRDENIFLDNAENTGDLSLGHASHHWGSKGMIIPGRDMYIIGSNMTFKKWRDSNLSFKRI